MMDGAPLGQQPTAGEPALLAAAASATAAAKAPPGPPPGTEEDDGLDSPTLEILGVEADTAVEPTPWRFGVAAAAGGGSRDPESLIQYLDRERGAAGGAPARRALIDHERGERLALQAWDAEGDGTAEGAARAARLTAAAEQAWRSALDADPGLRPPFWALWRSLTVSRRWSELLLLLEERLRHETDGQRRAELLFHKGWLLAEQLAQPASSADALRAAWLASDQRWIAPALALEQLGQARGETSWIEEACQAVAGAATDREARAAALRRLAALRRHQGPAGARDALALLERASGLVEPRLPLLYEREAIAAQAGLQLERVRALRAMAAALQRDPQIGAATGAGAAGTAEAACCLVQAAQLCELVLQDAAQAGALLGEARALAPADPVVAEAGLGFARRQGDWAEVVGALERRLAGAEAAGLPTGAVAATWLELAHAHARLGATAAADAALQRARALEPLELAVLVEAERAAIGSGRWSELVELALVEERAAATARPTDVAARAAILTRGALVAYLHAGRPDQAIDLCHAALELDPTTEAASGLLAELLLVRRRYVPLAEFWEQQLAGAAPDRAVAGLEQLADLAAGPLADPRRALDALDRLAQLRPGDRGLTLRRLALCERCGEWERADALLVALAATAGAPREREAHGLHRAWIAERPLADAQRAIDRYSEVLEADPTQPYALLALDGLLRASGQHAALALRWERVAEVTPVPAQRQVAREALAALYAGPLGQPERARAQLAHLVQEQPDERHALRALQRAQRAAGHHEALAEALARELPLISDRQALVQRTMLAGEAARQAGSLERAERHFGQVSSLAPADGVTWFAATNALVQLRLARGAFGEAAAALDALAEVAATETERELWRAEAAWWVEVPAARMAGAGEHPAAPTSAPAGAPAASRQGAPTVAAPGAGATLPELWRGLLGAAQRRELGALSGVLSELGARCDDPSLAGALRARGERLGRAVDSGAAGRSTIATSGARGSAPSSPSALLDRLGDPQTPASIRTGLLEQLVELLHERHRPQLRLTLSLAHELAGQPAAALQAACAVLRDQPDHAPALLTVQRLLAAADQPQLEARLWVRLARVLRGAAARREALRRAGACFERADLPAAAIATYRQLLADSPADPALIEHLATLCQAVGDLAQLDDALTLRLGLALAPERRQAILLERARLRAGQLADPRGAARDLLRLLALEPEHAEAWQLLARLADQAGDEARALSCYHRVLELDQAVEQRPAAVLRLTELLARSGRVAEAAALCRDQLRLTPEHPALLERLAGLYEGQGEPRRAAETLSCLVDCSGAEPRLQAAALQRLGELRAQVLGEPERARADLLRALALDPTNAASLAQLHRLSLEASDGAPGTLWAAPIAERLRELIRQQPARPGPYRALFDLATRLDDPALQRAAAAALDALGAATAAEQHGLRYAGTSAAVAWTGHLDPADWRRLQPAAAEGPYRELWRLLLPALPVLYPEHLPHEASQLGWGRLSSLEAFSQLPLSRGVERAARALGLDPGVLRVSKHAGDRILALHGTPPLLVLGAAALATDTPRQRFRLGRWLGLLHEQATALATLTPAELRLAVAGTIFCVEAGTGFGLPRERVAAAAQTLRRRLGRRTLRALPLVVQRLLQRGGSFEQWWQAVQTTADRCGLLLAGELGPALEQMAAEPRIDAAPGADAGAEAPRAEAGATEVTETSRPERDRRAALLAFSVSHELLELRRKLTGTAWLA